MAEIAKGDVSLWWIESTGQFELKYRGGERVYVASWEGHNQETARNIIDLLNAYLLTRGADVPEFADRPIAERLRLVLKAGVSSADKATDLMKVGLSE